MVHDEIKWLQQTIQKQFPHWNIDSFQTLGEGWMSKTFLVNEEWVFRFAKHQEASVDLGKEIRILPDLAAHLTLAIPQFEFTGRQANGLMYVVYKKVPGTLLDETKWSTLTVADRENVAKGLAGFLDELSSFPLETARTHHIPENDFQSDFRRTFQSVEETVFPLIDSSLRDQLTALFDHYLNEASYFAYQPTLIHADLSPDHYLYEETTGGLTGIIDFGDLQIGDPDFEYTTILEDGGEAFARQVMVLRGEKDIENLLKKIRIFVAFSHVATILECVKQGDKLRMQEGIEALKENLYSFQSPL